jgi:hypothetical protein
VGRWRVGDAQLHVYLHELSRVPVSRACACVCVRRHAPHVCACACVFGTRSLQEWARLVTSGKLSKGEKLIAVDHATINYPPFRKNFYIEVTGRCGMSVDECV